MSFWRTYYHLVWTTRNREPLITPKIEPRLYAYLIHKGAELSGYTYAINGWYDHVHMIVAIPPHVPVAHFVKHLKGASSHYLNQQQIGRNFAWQRGYGVLTIGQRQRPDAEAYVKHQKEHHSKQTDVAWLETCTEDNDGPDDRTDQTIQPVPALREAGPFYLLSGVEPAF